MSRLEELLRGTSLARNKASGLAIFTICSNNYMPMARILISSAKEFHPDAVVYLCLADERLPEDGFYPDHCEIVPIDELGIPDFDAFTFRYDIMELNTAVKPFMFEHLIRSGHETVLYFDPDIQIFAHLDQILTPLREGASFVLTPHLCAPSEGAAYPDDIGIMQAGIYNLGFLGVRACAESETVLAWWARRLEYQCVSDQAAGVFVDQKFMDLVPGFADHVHILRDTTANVAYWNLKQRALSFDGGWKIDGRQLGFFHFSGFGVGNLRRLSKHTEAFRGDEIPPVLADLMAQYAERLRENTRNSIPAGPYAYGHFASGTRIPTLVRRMFRERHILWGANPFETYEANLQAPMPLPRVDSTSTPPTNLMGYIHDREPWLRQNFDLTKPHGVRSLAEWFVRHGEEQVEYSGLTGVAAERLGRRGDAPLRRPPAARSPEEADIDVIGYLRAAMGVGEVGRLNLRSLNEGGLRASGLPTALNSLSPSNDHSCEHLLVSEAQARFQLFNVNCDQLPLVRKHLAPALRGDAYRILMPFWELAQLPDAWQPALDEVDEVWAPTRFIQSALVKKTDKPVLRMPVMLDFKAPPPAERSRFGLPSDSFLFFFSFDYLSFVERKNPLAVVKALKRAFRAQPRGQRVQLVLKTLNADAVPESRRPILDAVRDDGDIILVEQTLSREATLGLMSACDAVVTLHRSEGLGLLVAEAMVLGKPVVATNYSGTTDMVTPDTGWSVDFRMVPVQEGMYPYHEGQLWADPDIDHAAWQMRRVVNDRAEAERRARAAREMISREYGAAAVGGRQRARLRRLEGTWNP